MNWQKAILLKDYIIYCYCLFFLIQRHHLLLILIKKYGFNNFFRFYETKPILVWKHCIGCLSKSAVFHVKIKTCIFWVSCDFWLYCKEDTFWLSMK